MKNHILSVCRQELRVAKESIMGKIEYSVIRGHAKPATLDPVAIQEEKTIHAYAKFIACVTNYYTNNKYPLSPQKLDKSYYLTDGKVTKEQRDDFEKAVSIVHTKVISNKR